MCTLKCSLVYFVLNVLLTNSSDIFACSLWVYYDVRGYFETQYESMIFFFIWGRFFLRIDKCFLGDLCALLSAPFLTSFWMYCWQTAQIFFHGHCGCIMMSFSSPLRYMFLHNDLNCYFIIRVGVIYQSVVSTALEMRRDSKIVRKLFRVPLVHYKFTIKHSKCSEISAWPLGWYFKLYMATTQITIVI